MVRWNRRRAGLCTGADRIPGALCRMDSRGQKERLTRFLNLQNVSKANQDP